MRWVARGDEDPDATCVPSTSPAASRDGLMASLQIIASKRWTLGFGDFTQAFDQGKPLNRPKGRLFCEQPKEGIPGLKRGQLIELLKYHYGLTDGPYEWNQHVDGEFQGEGYEPTLLDICVYFLCNCSLVLLKSQPCAIRLL